MSKTRSNLWRIAALTLSASMMLAACGQEGGTGTSATPTAGGAGGTGDNTPVAGATVTTPEAGGGGSTGGGTSGGAVKNPDTIVEATIGDPETLDPAWAYDSASSEVLFNVYETLVFPKKESQTEFVPMLAEKLPEVSSDGKTYTFTIRQGVKFHDGGDLTAEDVAYTFWRGMVQDRSGGPQWMLLQPIFGLDVGTFKDDVVGKQFGGDFKAGCEALKQAVKFDNNARTVTMTLKQPYGPMLQTLAGSWGSIVDKEWTAAQGDWDGDCANAEKFTDPKAEDSKLFNKMNGTGAFKLDRWAPGEVIALARNDNYWVKEPLWEGGPSGPAKAARVNIQNISEFGTRLSAFQAGDVDIAYIDRQYVSQVDPLAAENCDATGNCQDANNANGFARIYKGLPTVANTVILLNQKVNTTGGNNFIGSGQLDGNGIPADFFSDVHIRKAFNYCFDFDTYIKQVWNGEAEQALGPIINGLIGYDASQAKYSFDTQKCADEFKASTLKSASGASVWDTGFQIQYVYNEGNDQRKVAGEVLKDGLQRVNPKFRIEVGSQPWPSFLKATNDGSLALYTIGWQQDFGDPHNWVTPYLSSSGAYAAQQGFSEDLQKQFDDLILQAVQNTDEAQRTDLYKQIQNLAYENAVDIFLVQGQGRHYEQSWLKGWYYNAGFGGNTYFYPLSKGE
jgi:peptide/nickel transport system substrate-binding protein